MKITYHADLDILRIVFNDVPVEESDETNPGTILDYDEAGNIVGIEILDASKRMDNPKAVEYAIAG